jgi:hypothetical protein
MKLLKLKDMYVNFEKPYGDQFEKKKSSVFKIYIKITVFRFMKRTFKRSLSTIPLITTKRTSTSHPNHILVVWM